MGPANICDGIFIKNSTVDLNAVTILANSSILGTGLGPACASIGGYNTVFKIQVDLFL